MQCFISRLLLPRKVILTRFENGVLTLGWQSLLMTKHKQTNNEYDPFTGTYSEVLLQVLAVKFMGSLFERQWTGVRSVAGLQRPNSRRTLRNDSGTVRDNGHEKRGGCRN